MILFDKDFFCCKTARKWVVVWGCCMGCCMVVVWLLYGVVWKSSTPVRCVSSEPSYAVVPGEVGAKRRSPRPPHFNDELARRQHQVTRQVRAFISHRQTTPSQARTPTLKLGGQGGTPITDATREHLFRTYRYHILT